MAPLKHPLWSRKLTPYRVVFYDFYVNTFAATRARLSLFYYIVRDDINKILRISARRTINKINLSDEPVAVFLHAGVKIYRFRSKADARGRERESIRARNIRNSHDKKDRTCVAFRRNRKKICLPNLINT